MSRLLDNLLLFGRVLRRTGVDVHPGRLLDLVEALGHVDLGSRDDVYHTCRTLLVHRQEQIPLFDRAFAAFWRTHHQDTGAGPKPRGGASASIVEIEAVLAPGDLADSDADAADESEPAAEVGIKTWSDLGGLRDKDFAAFSADEIARARIA